MAMRTPKGGIRNEMREKAMREVILAQLGALRADAAPRKRFCSAECERRSYYEGRRDKDHAKEEAEEGIPLREFQCEYCGHWVRVMSKNDKRFRFCSAKCEKTFWKRNKPQTARKTAAPAGKRLRGWLLREVLQMVWEGLWHTVGNGHVLLPRA